MKWAHGGQRSPSWWRLLVRASLGPLHYRTIRRSHVLDCRIHGRFWRVVIVVRSRYSLSWEAVGLEKRWRFRCASVPMSLIRAVGAATPRNRRSNGRWRCRPACGGITRRARVTRGMIHLTSAWLVCHQPGKRWKGWRGWHRRSDFIRRLRWSRNSP